MGEGGVEKNGENTGRLSSATRGRDIGDVVSNLRLLYKNPSHILEILLACKIFILHTNVKFNQKKQKGSPRII